MIGASFATATSPAAALPPREPTSANHHDGDAAPASHCDGDAMATQSPQRGNEATPASAASRRDKAAREKSGDDDRPPGEFARLLDTGSDAGTRADADPASQPNDADPDAVPVATDPVATVTLPEQLLALLSGRWTALPATTEDTASTGSPAGASAGARGLPPPVSAMLPGLAPATTTPTTGAVATDAAGDSFAALAKLAADALGATESSDASGAQGGDAVSSVDGLALAGTGPLAAPARAGVVAPTTVLAMPTDPDAGFDDGFGTRIAWMAEQRVGHAEIRLNPEHVGPIDVRVQLDGTRVSAEFHSAHAEVRQAIEASVPRLREMLGQHGLQLGHADVGQRHAQGQSPRGNQTGASGDPDTGRRPGDDSPTVAAVPMRSRGLLDEYA